MSQLRSSVVVLLSFALNVAVGLALSGVTSVRAAEAEASLGDVKGTWCSLGTSITWYNDNVSSSSGRFTKGYQTRVMEQVGFAGFLNKGVNAGCIASAINAVPAQAYDLYTIEHGVNDWGNCVSPATFEDNYRKVIDAILTANPNAKIILCTPRKAYGFNGFLPATCDAQKSGGYYLKDYVAVVRKIAAEKGFPVADFYAKCGEQDELASLSIDVALHPNDDGYQRMADELVRAMKRVYPELIEPGTAASRKILSQLPVVLARAYPGDLSTVRVLGGLLGGGYVGGQTYDATPYVEGYDAANNTYVCQLQSRMNSTHLRSALVTLTQNEDGDILAKADWIRWIDNAEFGTDMRQWEEGDIEIGGRKAYMDGRRPGDSYDCNGYAVGDLLLGLNGGEPEAIDSNETVATDLVRYSGFLRKSQIVIRGLEKDLSAFSAVSCMIGGSDIGSNKNRVSPIYRCSCYHGNYDEASNTYTCQMQAKDVDCDTLVRGVGLTFTQDPETGDVTMTEDWVRCSASGATLGLDLSSGSDIALASDFKSDGYAFADFVFATVTAEDEPLPANSAAYEMAVKSEAKSVPFQSYGLLFRNVKLKDAIGLKAISCVTFQSNGFNQNTMTTIDKVFTSADAGSYSDGFYFFDRKVYGDGARMTFQVQGDYPHGFNPPLQGCMFVDLVQIGDDVYGKVSGVRYLYHSVTYGADCEPVAAQNTSRYYLDTESETAVSGDAGGVMRFSLRDLSLVFPSDVPSEIKPMVASFDGCLTTSPKLLVSGYEGDLSKVHVLNGMIGCGWSGGTPYEGWAYLEEYDETNNVYTCQLQSRMADTYLRSSLITLTQDEHGNVYVKASWIRWIDNAAYGTDMRTRYSDGRTPSNAYTDPGYAVGDLKVGFGEIPVEPPEPMIVSFDGCFSTSPKLLVADYTGDLSDVHVLSGMIGCGYADGTPYEGWVYLEEYDETNNVYTCQLQSRMADTHLRSSLITLTQDEHGNVYVKASWIRWIDNAAYGTDMRTRYSDARTPNMSYTDPGYAVGDLKVGFGGATLPGASLVLVPTISDSAQIIIHGLQSDLSHFHALGCNLSGGYIQPKVTPGILECRPYLEDYDAATDTYTCQLQADKIDYPDTYVRGIGIEVKRDPVSHDVTLKAKWHGHSKSGATVGTDMSSAHTNMIEPNYVFHEFLFSVAEGQDAPLETAYDGSSVLRHSAVKTVPYQSYTKLFEGVSLMDVVDLRATACVTLGYGKPFVQKPVVASSTTADGFYFVERTGYGDAAHMTFQVQAKDNSSYTCAMLVDLAQIGADIYGKVSQAEYLNRDPFGTDCRTKGTAKSIRYYADDEDETSDPDSKYVYEASLRDLTLVVKAADGVAEWIGGETGDWSDRKNWSCGRVPSETDDVVLSTEDAVIRVDGFATAKSIAVLAATTLEIVDEATLPEVTGEGVLDLYVRQGALLDLGSDLTVRNLIVEDGVTFLPTDAAFTVNGVVSVGSRAPRNLILTATTKIGFPAGSGLTMTLCTGTLAADALVVGKTTCYVGSSLRKGELILLPQDKAVKFRRPGSLIFIR